MRLTLPEAPSLADAVVRAVQDGVAAGELEPGVTYSVYQLAEVLGISRSPVREALLRLAEAGLVRISRNRGFTVLVPSAHDIEEIVEIRLALEVPAARRAALAEERHAEVGAAWTAMRTATGGPGFWAADQALHDVLLRAAGNQRAAEIVARLRAITALLGPPTTASGRTFAEVLAEHEPVVTAVLARDGEAAAEAMRDHLERTGRLLAASFS